MIPANWNSPNQPRQPQIQNNQGLLNRA